MRHRLYATSRSAWSGMLTAIMAARETVYLEMYILENDAAGSNFLLELERRAREGLRVVVILDALGSFGLASSAIERLRGAGAEVLLWSSWFRRTHRKLLVIDEYVVFIGGVNISERFARWSDLEIKVTGRTVARSALRSFARMYLTCGGQNPVLAKRATPRLSERVRGWFIEHGVAGKHHALHVHYQERIDSATQKIMLVTPYLIPQRWLIARLHHAILRGVTVEIMIPEHTDHPFIDRINEHYCSILTAIGARCYLLPEMNHAKAMLIDEREAIVGSHNLDALSFDRNAEAGIFFDNKRMVADLLTIINKWKLGATVFVSDGRPRHWYSPLTALFLRMFHPVL